MTVVIDINKNALLEYLYKIITKSVLKEKYIREETFGDVIKLILNIS